MSEAHAKGGRARAKALSATDRRDIARAAAAARWAQDAHTIARDTSGSFARAIKRVEAAIANLERVGKEATEATARFTAAVEEFKAGRTPR